MGILALCQENSKQETGKFISQKSENGRMRLLERKRAQ
jgi:hypothetical protein